MLLVAVSVNLRAQDFPRAYKWLNNKEVAFTQDGSYTDEAGFTRPAVSPFAVPDLKKMRTDPSASRTARV